jgi:hypothetical protein
MFLKKNKCPRENECQFAGEVKTKQKQKLKKGGTASDHGNSGEVSSHGTDQAGVAVRD